MYEYGCGCGDDCGQDPHVNARECEHDCGRGSEAVAAAGLGCADASDHGFSYLYAHVHVTNSHDLMQNGGSASPLLIPEERIKILKQLLKIIIKSKPDGHVPPSDHHHG